jgi:RNase P protein component
MSTEAVLSKIIHKITKYLERQKIIIRDDDDGGFQLPISDEDTIARLQATSVTYRFATGKSKGKKALVLKSATDNDHSTTKGLVAKNSGFSLHAGVASKAHERDRLERVCRYIARPAVAEERLSIDDYGNVIYRFKKPWEDGTTALKLTPMELMERLVALVPKPKVHLTRYHGVLGPHYKYRKQIVPKPAELKIVSQDQVNIQPKQLELKPASAKKNIRWALTCKGL